MKKIVFHVLSAVVVLSVLAGCAAAKIVEADSQGGIVKYRKQVGSTSHRDDALAKAEKHCKHAGFSSYKLQDEIEDGEDRVVKFQCRQ